MTTLPEDEAGAQQRDDRLICPCVAILVMTAQQGGKEGMS